MEFFLFFWIGIGIVFAENHVWEKVELRVLPTPGIHCPTALTSTRQWINRSQFVLVQALAFNSSLATIDVKCSTSFPMLCRPTNLMLPSPTSPTLAHAQAFASA